MNILPILSLLIAGLSLAVAWHKRSDFHDKPYHFYFVYFHIAAVGLHQFEEYFLPGGFRESFVRIFTGFQAESIIPSLSALEILNTLILIPFFFAAGLVGTRKIWIGMSVLFINFNNALFHIFFSIINARYIPGFLTSLLLYLPLTLLALSYAIRHKALSSRQMIASFYLGTFVSLLPFLHVLVASRLVS